MSTVTDDGAASSSDVHSVLYRFEEIEKKLLRVLELVEAVAGRYARMESLSPEATQALFAEYFAVVGDIYRDLSAEIGKNLPNISSKKNHYSVKTDLDLCTAQADLALQQLVAIEEELLSR